MQTNRTPQAEVVSILHLAVDFQFLAFNADVGDPMLTATIGAAGDVQFQVLIEARQTLFQFLHQPSGEAFCFCNGKFAKLAPAARNGSAKKWRSTHRQSNCS